MIDEDSELVAECLISSRCPLSNLSYGIFGRLRCTNNRQLIV